MSYMIRKGWGTGIYAAALSLIACSLVFAQTQQPAITLNKPVMAESALAAPALAAPISTAMRLAPDYRAFTKAKVGEASEPQVFSFTFNVPTQVTGITGTPDFKVSGGTCSEGRHYQAGDTCTVEVAFTPQGPGHRSGKLAIEHTASATPFLVPTGGDATGPAVSFIPALISTVPSTSAQANRSAGLGAYGLAVDGGDFLYIADVRNSLVWYQDSSGDLSVLAGGGADPSPKFQGKPTDVKLNAPVAIAVDDYYDVLISDSGNRVVRAFNVLGDTFLVAGGGSNNSWCDTHQDPPCLPTDQALNELSGLVMDRDYNVFVNELSPNGGAHILEIAAGGFFGNFFYNLYSGFETISLASNYPLAIDLSGDLFYSFYDGVSCNILGEDKDKSTKLLVGRSWYVAGTRSCGFSGDGGLAIAAQISNNLGAFAWDVAGNFYFTDTGNQRVRRIDAVTGIIRTVAGNGTGMNSGDGGPATNAGLTYPVGLAVDSRGIVYVTSRYGGLTSRNAVVREVGTTGALTFAMQAINTSSPAQSILVSNVGNSPLKLKHMAFVSGNTGDFAIDPNSTNCDFTGDPMPSGQSCQIGVIFTPTATGARTAVLNLVDNTVAVTHQIQLSGIGATPAQPVLSPTSVAFPTTAIGATSAGQTITLSNTGGMPLTITGFGGTSSAPTGTFSMDGSSTCSASKVVAGGTSCTFVFTFAPPAAQQYTAQLSVQTTAGAMTANMAGTGAAAAQAVLTPKSLTFPTTNVGSSSPAQNLTLSNPGGMPLTVSSCAPGPGFMVGTNCPGAPVPAGGSVTFSVKFAPTYAGAFSSGISITTSAGTVSAALSGTTPAVATLTPSTIDFGSLSNGSTSSPRTAMLTNTGGATLTITSAKITGTNPTAFAMTTSCPATLASTYSCTYMLTFKPTSVAKLSATLSVVTAAGTVTTALSGTGTAPPTVQPKAPSPMPRPIRRAPTTP